ncbi:MAG: outer membrane beta-barrel protein [Hyphomicrobiaceae bacterium]
MELCLILAAALAATPALALDLKEIGADLAVTPAHIERLKTWESAKVNGARTAGEIGDPYGHPEYRRIGNFLVINRVDTALVYDSNVLAAPVAARSDLTWVTTPLLVVRSDLPRHILDLQLSGTFARQLRTTSLDHDDASARIAAIFHIDHAHILSLKSGIALTHEDRLAVGAALNATSLTPILHSFAAAGLKRDAGRLWASSGVSFDAWQYDDVRNAAGAPITQGHRDTSEAAVDFKLGYRFSPGFELIGRAKGLRRQNTGDVNVDTTAWGAEAIAGIRLELGPLFRLAFDGGYGIRDYDRAGVATAGIGLIEGRLSWLVTPSLTTHITISRAFDDGVGTATAGSGSGGRVQQQAGARLDYWLARNLMFTLGADYRETAFQDGGRVDQRLTGQARLKRHIGPGLILSLGVEHLDQRSTDPAFDIKRSQISAGARIRF